MSYVMGCLFAAQDNQVSRRGPLHGFVRISVGIDDLPSLAPSGLRLNLDKIEISDGFEAKRKRVRGRLFWGASDSSLTDSTGWRGVVRRGVMEIAVNRSSPE